MAGLPAHPGNDDTTGIEPIPGGPSWKSLLGIAVLVTLVALIVVLHLTGVMGPGGHE